MRSVAPLVPDHLLRRAPGAPSPLAPLSYSRATRQGSMRMLFRAAALLCVYVFVWSCRTADANLDTDASSETEPDGQVPAWSPGICDDYEDCTEDRAVGGGCVHTPIASCAKVPCTPSDNCAWPHEGLCGLNGYCEACLERHDSYDYPFEGMGCKQGERCISGTCVPFPTCKTDADCPGGLPHCITQNVGFGPYSNCVQCLDDADCPDGSACFGRVCRRTDETCIDNSDCAAGSKCTVRVIGGFKGIGNQCMPDYCTGPVRLNDGTCLVCSGWSNGWTACEEPECSPETACDMPP